MSLFHVKLRAVDSQKNINRDYEVLVMKVLFGFWGVTLAFGRHGTQGTLRNHTFETKEAAQKFVRKILQKRLTAPKRIGCSYGLVSVDVAKEEVLSFWVSPDQESRLKNQHDLQEGKEERLSVPSQELLLKRRSDKIQAYAL